MPSYTADEDLSCKPLTTAEKAWLVRLEKIAKSCPSGRLGSFCMGDCELAFYDFSKVDLCRNGDVGDGGAVAAGVELGRISTNFNIEGVSE